MPWKRTSQLLSQLIELGCDVRKVRIPNETEPNPHGPTDRQVPGPWIPRVRIRIGLSEVPKKFAREVKSTLEALDRHLKEKGLSPNGLETPRFGYEKRFSAYDVSADGEFADSFHRLFAWHDPHPFTGQKLVQWINRLKQLNVRFEIIHNRSVKVGSTQQQHVKIRAHYPFRRLPEETTEEIETALSDMENYMYEENEGIAPYLRVQGEHAKEQGIHTFEFKFPQHAGSAPFIKSLTAEGGRH